MPIKTLKPITPGQRGRTVNGFDAITTNKPEKSLLVPAKRSGGRNSQGKMTMKYRGGGHKKKYRRKVKFLNLYFFKPSWCKK